MTNVIRCINDILPNEILQKILVLSSDSFTDGLRVSSTCRRWRKLIFNALLIQRYWIFDNDHRRKGLTYWWNFNEGVKNQNNPFIDFPVTDCFLGKCINIDYPKVISRTRIDESQYTVNRDFDYTVAFWISVLHPVVNPVCLFMVSDDDPDYARSAGVCIDENNHLSIVFSSCLGSRVVPSEFKIKPEEETPCQKLWINGKIELTVEVPIAAYSNTAMLSFFTWIKLERFIADISVWSRCLKPLEIRAVHEQKTSIDNVDISKYIFEHFNH